MPAMPEMDLTLAGIPAHVRERRGVQTTGTLVGLDRIASAWERLAANGNPVSDS